MNKDQAKQEIKTRISCADYLQPAPNHSGTSGYCCPICGSGTHGRGSTGAVKYYQETNTWHCHACGKGGDVIDVYMAATGSDYNSALNTLAAQIGITIDESRQPAQGGENSPQDARNREQDKQPDSSEKPAQEAAQRPANFISYYKICSNRLDDPAAISYLQARGISPETARQYGIGYDPQADPATAPGATGDEYKPHPTPRIIIPCSASFYAARSIDPETPKKYKYMYPAGCSVHTFNVQAIYNNDVVFITEGVIDALSFIKAGQAAIALNGKGQKKPLLQALQEEPTQAAFIIVPDNDNDPKTAADTMKRATELNNDLRALNVKSIIYNVAGDQHDANDALLADRATFERAIAAAIRELQRDELTDFLEKIQTEAYKPYTTGLKFFDDLLDGGILQQSLLLLMAAPATGKTTLAQQIAETMAEHKKPVLYLNFEMSREQMLAKAISAKLYRMGVEKTAADVLQGYTWTDRDRANISLAIDEYRRTNYPYIKYNPAGTSSELNDLLSFLKATGEAAKAKGEPAPAAVIDYLHLITSKDGLDTAELIKQAVTGLKKYAIDYNTFVIGITATNRETNKSGRMSISSGRDSSNLEYTADYQLSLNYLEIDKGNVNPDNAKEMEKLQRAELKSMILRVHKARLSTPGKSAEIIFNAKSNSFYGTCDDRR